MRSMLGATNHEVLMEPYLQHPGEFDKPQTRSGVALCLAGGGFPCGFVPSWSAQGLNEDGILEHVEYNFVCFRRQRIFCLFLLK